MESPLPRWPKGAGAEQERFWARVTPLDGDDACWIWRGGSRPTGYGVFAPTHGQTLSAHRYAYELTTGDIPAGFFVCHHCDNPRCVRPSHLFVGSPLANSRDMVAKGRSRKGSPACGQGHPFVKWDRRGRGVCQTCRKRHRQERQRQERERARGQRAA